MIDNIDEATDEILKNLDLLRDGNKEWFQKLANNQKVQVLNQITLLRRQKKSNIMLSEWRVVKIAHFIRCTPILNKSE